MKPIEILEIIKEEIGFDEATEKLSFCFYEQTSIPRMIRKYNHRLSPMQMQEIFESLKFIKKQKLTGVDFKSFLIEAYSHFLFFKKLLDIRSWYEKKAMVTGYFLTQVPKRKSI